MKKLQIKEALERMRDSIKNCAIHSLTFLSIDTDGKIQLTQEEKNILEKYIQERFKLWSNSWILPQIEFIEEEIDTK